MSKKIVMAAVVLALTLFAADYVVPVNHEWKTYDVVTENAASNLRLRVRRNGGKFWGHILKSFPKGEDGQYLQVVLGNMESSAAAPQCGNASRNGGAFGRLYSGYNTFAMPAHAKKGNFALTLSLMGVRTEDVGPWCDFKEVRVTEAPLFAPVVTLLEGDTIKVGSRLKIALKLDKDLAIEPVVRFSLNPKFLPYTFDGQNQVSLKKTAPALYEAEITVNEKAISYSSASIKKYEIYAVTEINHMNCHFKIPYAVEIKTDNILDESVIDAASNQVRDDRMLWLKRSKGVNLIRGKKLVYAPKPHYVHTRMGDTDEMDLTDGKLSPRTDDKIWFEKSAVGWYNGGNDVYIKMDLGSVQPVDKLVARFIGGTRDNFTFPRIFRAFVSKDGNTYHQTFSMEKLAPSEGDQCDWKNYYYIPEEARHPNTRMYPFEIGVNADARYVILNIVGVTGSIFSDEIVCLKAEQKGEGFNSAYENIGTVIPMEGVILRPRLPEIVVLKDLAAAQWLNITDMRVPEDYSKDVDFVIELPKGITVYDNKGKALPESEKYIFPIAKIAGNRLYDPFFFMSAKGEVSGNATIYARCGGVEQFRTMVPLRTIEMPEIKPFKRLELSLSWMSEGVMEMWPDYLNVWRKFGFNIVTLFPRYWTNSSMVEKGRKKAEEIKKAGYPIIMNDSPYHEMHRNMKKFPEICCQVPGQNSQVLCPSYRGPLFEKEMERVKKHVIDSRPDFIYNDVEAWTSAHGTSPHCTRCQEGMRKSGKNLNEYLLQMGDETCAALRKAVNEGAAEAGIKPPLIGSYAREALKKNYAIEEWNRTYPAYIDMAQPSLYVNGRARDIHDRVLENYKLMGNKKIIPFLTTGTYGEFEPYKVEFMVLEALVNGAGGVTYFSFNYFDTPLDFYYHAKAMAALQDYEDLIVDGIPRDISGSNKKLVYSITVKGDEAILLVGNYDRADPDTVVELPFKPSVAKDLRSGENVKPAQKLELNVPKSNVRLIYIRK